MNGHADQMDMMEEAKKRMEATINLQVRNDIKDKVRRGVRAAHVSSLDCAVQDGFGNSIGDLVSMVLKAKVTEHHDGGEDHGQRVGCVLSLNVPANMATALQKVSIK